MFEISEHGPQGLLQMERSHIFLECKCAVGEMLGDYVEMDGR